MASTPLTLPTMPPTLKPLMGILKSASDFEKVDPIVTYWCRLYAFQLGLSIDKKSPECLNFLTTIMTWLEKEKVVHKDNEAMTNELVAQAHIENHAMKLFVRADSEDRAGKAGRNALKIYFTASQLFDTLNVFGEQSEEAAQKSKYAKWRAAYISRCIKNGETPLPPEDDGDNLEASGEDGSPTQEPSTSSVIEKPDTLNLGSPHISTSYPNQFPGYYPPPGTPASQPYIPPSQPTQGPSLSSHVQPSVGPTAPNLPSVTPKTPPKQGSTHLDPEALMKAQKYCKYAGSALQYEDINTAVDNLEKALALLKTDQQS